MMIRPYSVAERAAPDSSEGDRQPIELNLRAEGIGAAARGRGIASRLALHLRDKSD